MVHVSSSPTECQQEAIWVGSKSNLAKLTTRDCSLQIGESTIQQSTVVRNLGVHLDHELSITQHISTSCYYHLRRLRQIRRRIMSRTDYCNSVLAGLPVDDRTTTTGAERRCSTGLQARHTRARHRQPSSAVLAAGPLASPVQAVLSYALHLSREVSGLLVQHREAC